MPRHKFLGLMNKTVFLLLLSLLAIRDGLGQMQEREFRAVWIATVKNIDWPSRADLSVEQQQQDLISMLDGLKVQGFNAIIFQIRPGGDAFYESSYEPWSQWLTGTEGKAPTPFYDPLSFLTQACHERGMELHAWFNPFRTSLDWDSSKVHASTHLTQTHPDWLVQYGKNLYLDPGIPAARNYVRTVIMDVVDRYEIDAVHFDDYFYPYRIDTLDFPDTISFRAFGQDFDQVEDWRRNNVNQFVQDLHDQLQVHRPYVQLGISPFGVWRNKDRDSKGSDSRAGQTSYDDLFADVRHWLAEGWIDYVAPQVYFSIGYPPAAFEKLLDWWSQNSFGRNVYIGHAAYKIANNHDKNWENPDQIPAQIRLLRQYHQIHGSAFFSAKWLPQNPLGVSDSLQNHYYKQMALPPRLPWLDKRAPLPPVNVWSKARKGGIQLRWDNSLSSSDIKFHIVYRASGRTVPQATEKFFYTIIWGNPGQWLDQDTPRFRKHSYLITAVDRAHNESEANQLLVRRRWW
ncbi:MAG: family 10 glycosylhydrolase [Bacteroidota bacterium]